MPQLVRDGTALTRADLATTRRRRRRGLLGQTSARDALVLQPCRQVHTVGMRFPIDIVWCDAEGRVLHTATLEPGRVSRWIPRARFVVEVAAGWARHWNVQPGDRLVVAPDEP